MMQTLIVLTKDTITDYAKAHPKLYNHAWKQRDFVAKVTEYMHHCSGGIILISGLRGTGKTVGLMQTIEENDALYLRCTEKGKTSIEEIQDIINAYPDKFNIIIDEFTWLKEFLPLVTDDDYARRSDAERLIVALSESGKNIFLTGAESASLEAIKARGFIHRTTDTLHVTRFSYAEFRRIYEDHLPSNLQEAYYMYLREGGIFEEHVKQSIGGMDGYIRSSIVENLYSYIGRDAGLTRRQIVSAVYTVLFEAVNDISSTKGSREVFIECAKDNLASMGIPDVNEKLHPRTVQRISELLESIGVIIKISNVIPRQDRLDKEEPESDDVRTYIVNPAILYQLSKLIISDINEDNAVLRPLMQAAIFAELDAIKRPMDKIYFYKNDNIDVDAVIAQIDGNVPLSMTEVKRRYAISGSDIHNKTWLPFSDEIKKSISKKFSDNVIYNKYFVYTGQIERKYREMFYTYPEDVMPQAMDNLGTMYAYAVERWGYDIDDFQNLFLESGTAKSFESGVWDVIDMPGPELANYVLWASKLPQRELGHGFHPIGPEYLAGRTVAQYQRILGWSFQEIHNILPMSRIVELVDLPEMDDHDMLIAVAEEICRIRNAKIWEKIQEYEKRTRHSGKEH